MSTNVFFNHAVATEQHLVEDLIVESLRMYGHDVLYLPRQIVEEGTILRRIQTFDDAIPLKCIFRMLKVMRDKDLILSLVSILMTAEFIMSVRTWERFVSLIQTL